MTLIKGTIYLWRLTTIDSKLINEGEKDGKKISLLLIRALSEQDGFMTTKEIAAKVGVSTKTVRRYVEKINQSQSLYGCVIQGKKGSGLFLQIINHELFQRSLENTPQEDFVTQIIEYFVQEDEYIKSELLCERLFISQKQVISRTQKLRRILSHYNLSIQTKALLRHEALRQ